MPLMSDILCKAICFQIAHEKYNANLYLVICGFLRNKGLDNLAKLFEHQHQEETEHALDFFNLLTDLSAPVMIPEINEVNVDFPNIKAIAEEYLNKEIETTKSIDEIKKLAIEESNPVVEEFMRKMITEQQKEYEEASSFLDNALLCEGEDSWWKAKVWNDSICGEH